MTDFRIDLMLLLLVLCSDNTLQEVRLIKDPRCPNSAPITHSLCIHPNFYPTFTPCDFRTFICGIEMIILDNSVSWGEQIRGLSNTLHIPAVLRNDIYQAEKRYLYTVPHYAHDRSSKDFCTPVERWLPCSVSTAHQAKRACPALLLWSSAARLGFSSTLPS